MKIALIGVGKTGQHLLPLIAKDDLIGPFDSKNILTLDKSQNAQVGIVFVTADVFTQIYPTLLNLPFPLVIGTTGVKWSDEIKRDLITHQRSWLYGSNFSLGIQLFRKWIQTYQQFLPQYNQHTHKLVDIHHIHKKDSPSGTAKSLASWLNADVAIDSRREGDVIGFHELTIHLPFEELKISHNAKNRSVFAQGALQMAKQWSTKNQVGLLSLEDYLN